MMHGCIIIFSTVPSGSPNNIESVGLNSSSLLLTWQPPLDHLLNGILRGYIVNLTETETGNHYQISSDVAQYTFNDLHPFYRYTFIVAALTIGRGPYSEINSIQMPQDGMIYMFFALCVT